MSLFAELRLKAPRGFQEVKDKVTAYLETYRLQVFWLALFCLVTAGVFIERAYCKWYSSWLETYQR